MVIAHCIGREMWARSQHPLVTFPKNLRLKAVLPGMALATVMGATKWFHIFQVDYFRRSNWWKLWLKFSNLIVRNKLNDLSMVSIPRKVGEYTDLHFFFRVLGRPTLCTLTWAFQQALNIVLCFPTNKKWSRYLMILWFWDYAKIMRIFRKMSKTWNI